VLFDETIWTLVQSDEEGWIKHDGDEYPLPDDAPCLLRFKAGSETGRTAGKHWCWDLGTISHYKPILEQEETTPAPQYDPRSVSFNLLKRLQAAHEAAQTIPDLEAKLREVLGSMGYDLVSRSPFVEPEAAVEPDMTDWRNWRDNDLIRCVAKAEDLTEGKMYRCLINKRGAYIIDNLGLPLSICSHHHLFRFHSRPAKGDK
jgi:hypothetical protein